MPTAASERDGGNVRYIMSGTTLSAETQHFVAIGSPLAARLFR
jgi:hypothetical protein